MSGQQREADEDKAREQALHSIEQMPWQEHVRVFYDEIAALCQALGVPTPNLRRAGLEPGGPGTILASFQQLAQAVKQVQGLVIVNEARTRALLGLLQRLAPGQAHMFQAVFDQASDLAEQQAADVEKQGRPGGGGIVLPH